MGFIGSPMADAAIAAIPLGRLGTPDDYGPVEEPSDAAAGPADPARLAGRPG